MGLNKSQLWHDFSIRGDIRESISRAMEKVKQNRDRDWRESRGKGRRERARFSERARERCGSKESEQARNKAWCTFKCTSCASGFSFPPPALSPVK